MRKPGGIEVSITDSGPGLDPAIAGQIFNTFATTKPEGMGVGLSICKSIIEAHGGELVIRDDPGNGATFSFTLPIAHE
jgi:two-component system sensor kinase FixL